MSTLERIAQQITGNTVILYMKGTPDFPQCGFSAKVVNILINLGAKFAFVNVLAHPEIRAELPKYADWPTFPQLYISGELIGGCDIVTELHANQQLLPLLEQAGALQEKAIFVNAEE